jgi:NAD(P)-dependent dehydrogenase (short-subunit alcohol dehydrogenase family)/enamine deaminase RidA (YjgF/YER057c/UK114 family)
MHAPLTRLGTTTRWSDAALHQGTVHVVEVPATLPAPAAEQARQVLAQLEATLLHAGSSKERLLMVTVYLADMADRAAFNAVWDAWLVPGTAPVRACVQVGLAEPDYRVEIHAVAAPWAEKTALITGSTSGIGCAGAVALARRGWRVLVHARSRERGAPALEALQKRVPGARFDLVTGDLSDLRQVASLADQVEVLTPALDGLWYNAGLMTTRAQSSADGFELQWAVNHLAAFALVRRLLPRVEAAPQGRIVLTSSMAHHIGRVPTHPSFVAPSRYSGWQTYGDTKLANILLAHELARQTADTRISVHAFHPGYVRTSFGSNGQPGTGNDAHWLRWSQITPDAGASTGVFLLTDPAGAEGRPYWSSRKPRRGSPRITANNARRLWDLSEAALARQ